MSYYSSSWKKHRQKESRKSLVAIFLTVLLLLAVFSGFTHILTFGKRLNGSWDGKSPIAIAYGSSNPSIIIFQTDPKKIFVLAVDGGTLYENGQTQSPLESISQKINSGKSLSVAMSKTFGVNLDKFVVPKNTAQMGETAAQEVFKNFASITTPIAILTGGYKKNIQDTNITRIDAFRLWWQLKGLSVKDVVFSNLSSFTESILVSGDQKVLGADTATLSREAGKYLRSDSLSFENFNITIINESDSTFAPRLASYFITSAGGKVGSVEASGNHISKCLLTSSEKSAYTTNYLAKMLNCDINIAQNSEDSRQITIELGEDFAKNWSIE